MEVYKRVNEIVQFTPQILVALKQFDQATNLEEQLIAKAKIAQLQDAFYALRKKVEETYAKTRLIHKPQDYILDQDHHHHLANQLHAFDWQFVPELMIFDKIKEQLFREE